VRPFEVRFRIEAATDLLEQVQRVLKDAEVHVAAPIVLAGAALEEFLRSMFEESGAPLVGRPGLAAYADALRKADLLNRGEVTDITSWADQRNAPAARSARGCSFARPAIRAARMNGLLDTPINKPFKRSWRVIAREFPDEFAFLMGSLKPQASSLVRTSR
jgi:hypothetical protein